MELVEVKLAQFGMGMQEGEVVRWLKRVGDAVEQDEVFVEVEAAKSTVEVAAPCTGMIVEICVEEGAVAPVLAVLARIRPT